jgi:hypothetical protein
MTDAQARLCHPFDQYQRYQVATDLLALVGVKPGSTVLDVGGAAGPAEDFLGDYDLTIVDVDRSDLPDRRFVLASGATLPFPDESFDVVLSQDTLEHVPSADRPAFLSELTRVAREAVVLCAPFSDPLVQLAERALHEFVTVRFGGHFATLEEHAEHGLPNLDETVNSLAHPGWPTAVLPSGYLPHWLAGMLVHHELLATGVGELDELHAFYNITVSPSDCRSPSYRHVVVAARDRDQQELEDIVGGLRAPDSAPLATSAVNAIAQAVFAQRIQGVLDEPGEQRREQIAALERQVANLERQVADRDGHIMELRHQLEISNVHPRPVSALVRDRLADARRRWKEHR